MNKWLTKFLENKSQKSTDSTDRFSTKTNMSVLSVHSEGALDNNLGNVSKINTDSTDRFNYQTNMSVLSVHSEGALDNNLRNVSKINTNNTDRFNSETNMSVLSVHSEGALDNNLRNVSKINTDNTDRFNSKTNMLGASLQDSFEERLAIAEYDGHQTPLQSERMAYLEAFLTLLFDLTASDPHREWLVQKVQAARATLEKYYFPIHH